MRRGFQSKISSGWIYPPATEDPAAVHEHAASMPAVQFVHFVADLAHAETDSLLVRHGGLRPGLESQLQVIEVLLAVVHRPPETGIRQHRAGLDLHDFGFVRAELDRLLELHAGSHDLSAQVSLHRRRAGVDQLRGDVQRGPVGFRERQIGGYEGIADVDRTGDLDPDRLPQAHVAIRHGHHAVVANGHEFGDVAHDLPAHIPAVLTERFPHRVGCARMVHGADLYRQCVGAGPDCIRDVELKPLEHAGHGVRVGDAHTVQPHAGAVVDGVEVQPDPLARGQVRQRELGAIPPRIAPWIALVGQVAEPGQIVLGVKGVAGIGDPIRVQPDPQVWIDLVLDQRA